MRFLRHRRGHPWGLDFSALGARARSRLAPSVMLIALIAGALGACDEGESAGKAAKLTMCDERCRIKAVRFGGFHSIPYLGDLWPSAVGPRGKLYLAFGDGSGLSACLPVEGLDWWPPPKGTPIPRMTVREAYGEKNEDFCGVNDCAPGKRYPLCPYTRAGLIALEGTLPNLRRCPGRDECLIARHLPTGREKDGRDVKPSSLLFVGRTLYMHLHEPSARPRRGFFIRSHDFGRSWQEIAGSPWGEESNFRVMALLQDRRKNRRWVYGFGVANEIDVDDMRLQRVWLARAPLRRMADYSAWRYFAGLDDDGRPRWAASEKDAKPLEGLATMIQGSALYHRGLGRYLFFSGFSGFAPAEEIGWPNRSGPAEAGYLFEAPNPWGPWALAGKFPGGYIGALIARDGNARRVWFTAAGNTVTYNLHIGRLDLKLR